MTLSEATGSPLDLSQPICEIVSAYVSNNHVARSELPALIAMVQHTLRSLATGSEVRTEEPTEKPTTAQIRRSITPDALISFIDGKPYKTLKRHLTAKGFDLSTYRARFGLPADYPTVAPSYSARRSVLARSLGLGQVNASPPQVEPVEPAKRGRPKRT
jgi:predicted transcriptional regulator